MPPCRRFADVLADARARLGADVGRYSFIEVDLHHILLAGLPAHSLALRPAHSRGHLYVTSYTEGFSHFVTSMTAPVASGWSGWPGGARTHWKAPPCHGAHGKRAFPNPSGRPRDWGKARPVARASQAINFPLAERKAGQRVGQWRACRLGTVFDS